MVSRRVEQFRKLAALDPSDVLTHFGLGNACLEEGLWEEAVQAFKKTLEIKPDYTAVYPLLAEALQKLSRMEEVKEVLRKGLEVAEQTRDMMPKQKMEAKLRGILRREEQQKPAD